MNTVKHSMISMVFFGLTSLANAECNTYPGSYICQNGEANTISGFYGSIVLKHMIVNGNIHATAGALSIENSMINTIHSNFGSLSITDTASNGDIKGSIGSIYLKSSQIRAAIDGQIGKCELNQSTAKQFDDYSNSSKKSDLILTNHSQIEGNVSFHNATGKVCIDNTSSIKGNIINATVSYDNCK